MTKCIALLLGITLFATTACKAAPPSWRKVDRQVRSMLLTHPLMLKGAAVYVGKPDGTVIYERYYGRYDETTAVPLASASKLLSATAIMTLIDQGKLDAHAPVETYLTVFSSSDVGETKSSITIDQMYSMTSGFPVPPMRKSVLADLDLTLEEAVDQIACCVEVKEDPGTALIYSGYGMHIAGRICEVKTNKPYNQFFDAAVNTPLSTNITWQGLGDTENFRPSGSGQATLRDYAKVLTLVANGGETGGVRLFSEQATDSMFIERTAGLPTIYAPDDAADLGYGYAFGMWVEDRNTAGEPTVVSSPGFFGFTPWIDLEDGYVAIIMVKGFRSRLLDDLNGIRATIDDVVNERGTADSDGGGPRRARSKE